MPPLDYRRAAIGVYHAGNPRCSLLTSDDGKVIVFDTVTQAQQYLPLLGQGRPTRWKGPEEVAWIPTTAQELMAGINRACILTDYDPYHLPSGLPIRSETRSREWRHHVHVSQIVARPDGNWANLETRGANSLTTDHPTRTTR